MSKREKSPFPLYPESEYGPQGRFDPDDLLLLERVYDRLKVEELHRRNPGRFVLLVIAKDGTETLLDVGHSVGHGSIPGPITSIISDS